MPMTSSTFTELLLDEQQKEIFGLRYDAFPTEFDKFFDVQTSQHAFEYFLETFGFGLFQEIGEDVDIPMDRAGQSYKTTLTHLSYANGYDITQDMIDDSQFNTISQLPADLADSLGESKDTTGMDYLNNYATNTTKDGAALISTAHKVSRTTGNFANRPATPSSLSQSSMEDDMIYVGRMLSPAGRKKNYKLSNLLVPRELTHQAEKLIESDKEPATNRNAINTVRGTRAVSSYMVSNYLTSASVYFYRTNIRGLMALVRKDMEFDSEKIKRRRKTEFYAYYRMVFGCYDPRSIWANGMAS